MIESQPALPILSRFFPGILFNGFFNNILFQFNWLLFVACFLGNHEKIRISAYWRQCLP